ncbi:MAG: hypothetical protein VYD87_21180 [Pseudomonadota bacterium]|nr:hypothetical protein [Pseudomonadota bacterium]MEE3098572.1 hypothetical protein [Pseudomonadota bacterium]
MQTVETHTPTPRESGGLFSSLLEALVPPLPPIEAEDDPEHKARELAFYESLAFSASI